MSILKALIFCLILSIGKAEEDDGVTVEVEEEPENESPEVAYTSPVPVGDFHFAENFDDPETAWKNWILSKAKKDIEDSELAKYNGKWNIQSAIRDPISGDNGLVISLPAKHSAISAKLNKPFIFDNKPLIVQYEVIFQEGQECGGAYMKLLTGETNLSAFHDKTPYTIMFGPDKCGNDLKLHFIFQHKNPKTGEMTEKHAKRPISKLSETFKDKKPHLYTLIVRPDNSYEISVDRNIVSEGNLLTDFTPPVNPPEEIDDPSDRKPEDWDEREKIPDPTAVKPDDWDENEPKEIPDEDAVKPDDWLEDEPEMVPDPTAVMPEDWDEEMDGEWEAPLINNPKCEKVSGCGDWKRPMKPNPKFKGKWSSPIIDNPNYKGKWKPRKVPNPDYFYDDNPFKMAPIDAIGFELWSVSSGIYFDNIIISDDKNVAEQWAQQSYDLKLLKIDKDSVGLVGQFWKYTNKHPWLWAVYVVVIGLPLVLIISFCLPTKSSESKSDDQTLKDRKKTDEPTPDDEEEAEEKPEDHSKSDDEKVDDEGVANDSQEEIDESLTGGGDSGKGSPRKRKNRKEM